MALTAWGRRRVRAAVGPEPTAGSGRPAPDDDVHVDAGSVRETLTAEWDALADRVDAPPWLRPGWFAAWRAAFGQGREHLVAVRDGARLVAVMPVQEHRRRVSGPTNWHTPWFGVVSEAGRVGELAQRLLEGRPHRITLSFVREDEETLGACRDAFARAGYSILERTLQRSPYLELGGGWAEYEQRLGAHRRKDLRRFRRRLDEVGRVEIVVEPGSSRLEELLDEGFAVEARGWKGRVGTAITSRPQTALFYRALARWAAARGWLRLAFLRVESRAIAFDFALETGAGHFPLKIGFDEDYRQYAPSVLLRHAMIQRAFAQGLPTYEFGGNTEPWKLDWTSSVREKKLLQAFAPSLAGRTDALAFRYGRPVAKRVLAAVGRRRPTRKLTG